MIGTSVQEELLEAGLCALESGQFLPAHEHFEAAFRASEPPARTLFHGLAQLAASFHQLVLGRARASYRTSRRALAKLASIDALSPQAAEAIGRLHAELGLSDEGPRLLESAGVGDFRHFIVLERALLTAILRRPQVESAQQATGGLEARSVTTMMEPAKAEVSAKLAEQTEEGRERASAVPEAVGFVHLLGLRVVAVSESEVTAELEVGPQHHQPMGIVHGGVYASIVETVCSIGAYVHASKRDLFVVGVDNQTSFLKATRNGLLRAQAKPLAVGRRTQLWEAHIRDAQDALVATGRVRLICVEPEAKLGGAAAGSVRPPKG